MEECIIIPDTAKERPQQGEEEDIVYPLVTK
jgi:hypothetical protein